MKPTSSYLHDIWSDPIKRKFLLWGLGLSVIEFIIFKLLYPYPDFFSDSYSYLFAASANLDVSIWPIGYSKILAFFHNITFSDTAFVGFQYFLFQFSLLHLFFTTIYFFEIQVNSKRILFYFLFVNPLSLYLCNVINSDAIFSALSIFWITELIWIIQRPRFYQVITQAVLLFLCFSIRNNAYYYPAITLIAFLLSKQNWIIKTLGIVLPFLLIIPFIRHTESEAYKLTGTRQYSLFTGWQLANNALYIYDQIEVDSADLPTPEAKELNRLSIEFLKHRKPDGYRPFLESFVGNFFIKYSKAPLKTYYNLHYPSKDEMGSIRTWGKASAAFEPFGKYIILHYPYAYAKYFMLPNTWHYILPPLSHLEEYNYGGEEIDPIAKDWFHFSQAKVHCVSTSLQGFLIIYVAGFLLFNAYFLYQLVRYFMIFKRSLLSQINHKTYILISVFLLVNFLFSIFATVNILRYQIVPMIALVAFGLSLSDYLERLPRKKFASRTRSHINEMPLSNEIKI